MLRVYDETPKSEHIVCVDEKTAIQALERRYADTQMEPDQPLRREFEYLHHGTLCWMGAFDVRRGKPFGFTADTHDSDTFVELLDVIDLIYPPDRGHIIVDNLSAHDTPDVPEWFDEHRGGRGTSLQSTHPGPTKSSAGSPFSAATSSPAAPSPPLTTSPRRSTLM